MPVQPPSELFRDRGTGGQGSESIRRARELQRPLFHLGSHEVQGVGAGGGQMLLESRSFNEGEVCSEDVVGGLAVQEANEEGDHSLGDL